eukprot:Skav213473  [mRNA]  locus=scaffold3211:328632:331034:- [translate_table: standard]
MAWILDLIGENIGGLMVGIVQWGTFDQQWQQNYWFKNTNLRYISNDSVMMIYDAEHWIPVIIKTQEEAIIMASHEPMGGQKVEELLQFLHIPHFTVRHVQMQSEHGLCGWHAVNWICQGMNLTSNIARRHDNEPWTTTMQRVVGRTDTQLYMQAMDKVPVQLKGFLVFRESFINKMMYHPSTETFKGFGDTTNNLRLAGKLAAILIGHGHGDSESTVIGHKLAEQCPKQAKPIINQKDSKSYGSLLELCVQQGIHVTPVGSDAAAVKLQKFFRAKQEKRQKPRDAVAVNLSQVQFQDDSFEIPSGQKLTPYHTWSTTHRGVAIATLDQVRPYLLQDKQLSLEVCTALVSQKVESGDHIKVEPAEVMVTDESRNRALIRIFMIHFGAVRPKPAALRGADVMIESQPSSVIVTNVYRYLVDADFWETLKKSPAKTILQSIFRNQEMTSVHQIWSRRWQKSMKQVDPNDAENFSMLLRVPTADVSAWLKRSGVGAQPIFVATKIIADEQPPEEAHRVIWIGKTLPAAVAALTQCPDHIGLVHRAPCSYGIRVEAKRFPSLWKELKGEDEVPTQIPIKFKFVISGAPPSLGGPLLEKWGDSLGWPLRALKRFGNGKFLVGSNSHPPAYHMLLDKHQVIITAQETKSAKPEPSIILGKLQIQEDKKCPDKGNDDLWENDPWGAWRESHPEQEISRKPSRSSQDRNVVAPDSATTELMSKQSQRLTTVESELQQLKQQIAEDQQATQTRFNQVDTTIQGMGNQLRLSMEEELKAQTTNLMQTFENLLKRSPRDDPAHHRSRSPPPR